MNQISRQRPEHYHRAADLLLLWIGVVFAFSLCFFFATAKTGVDQIPLAPMVFGALCVGLVFPRLLHHRWRALGITPIAATAAFILAGISHFRGWPDWAILLFNVLEGAACGAVFRFRDRFRDEQSRFVLSSLAAVGIAMFILVNCWRPVGTEEEGRVLEFALLASSFILAVNSIWFLSRPALEIIATRLVNRLYAVQLIGSGEFPEKGPFVVIANHASWFDPLILATKLSRPITPLMTSLFYDKPFLRPILGRVFHVIRVPDAAARREAPEIQEAIAAIDAGECVMLFPEGYLRRSEEQELRRFGRGVWQILEARPNTPVIPCWIEGTWGSYFSHRNGPPTENKRFDRRLPVSIAIGEPHIVPKDLLSKHLCTRIHLMNLLLHVRKSLKLPEVPPFPMPASDKKED